MKVKETAAKTFDLDLDPEDIYRGAQINGSSFSRALCLDLITVLVSVFNLTFIQSFVYI